MGHTGQGIIGLSWVEISAWASQFYSSPVTEFTSIEGQIIPVTTKECSLSMWELLTIKDMSAAYAAEYSQASQKDRPAPHEIAEELIDKAAQAKRFRSIIRSNFMINQAEPRYEVETE